jgi:hypothetical protein
MSSKSPVERATREAIKAAQRAREFADLFEKYANALKSDGPSEHAKTMRILGKNKLAELKEAVSDCEYWIEINESSREAKSAVAWK